MGTLMLRPLKFLLSAGALAFVAGAGLAANPAEARTSIFLGIGLPPIYIGPPAY